MKNILKFFGFLATLFIFSLAFYAAVTLWQLTPITDPSKYQNVITLRWHDQDLIEHFPEIIPAYAGNTRLYYRGGFLQGGSTIELRVRMPDNFIESVYQKYRPEAKATYNGAEKLEGGVNHPNKLPKWRFATFSPDEYDTQGHPSLLPQDFEILLLQSHPSKTNPGDWNHGQSSGISISRQRREIIYWAEDW